jgi:hypothetical protein
VQQLLEPAERLPVVEDDRRKRAAVDLALGGYDSVAHPRHDCIAHVRAAKQVMNDLVARHCRGAVARERFQRLALARSDAAGDRDGDWPGH